MLYVDCHLVDRKGVSCGHWYAQVTDLRLRGFRIRERDAVLLGGLKLQRLQFDGVAFEGRSLISKLSSLQVTLAVIPLSVAIIGFFACFIKSKFH